VEWPPFGRHLSIEDFEIEYNILRTKQQIVRGRGISILIRLTKNSKIVYEYNAVK